MVSDNVPQMPAAAASQPMEAPLEADGDRAVHVSMSAPALVIEAEEPARSSKRRRLSTRTKQAAAVPEQHQHGEITTPVKATPADKEFSDEDMTVERLQSVQCDRCSKWRLIDPNDKVRACDRLSVHASGGTVLTDAIGCNGRSAHVVLRARQPRISVRKCCTVL